ncbi:MAG: serine hydrolase [Clostridiales bacterium]|nr:serine hydrolase [Clostridiales bacterium]
MDRFAEVFALLQNTPGKVGLYAKNLLSGEVKTYHPDDAFLAASVIKIPVMVECFYQAAEGRLDLTDTYCIKAEDKLPSCGALSYMHDGLTVTIKDLITLMIILSDNTATNILMDMVGIENINQRMRSLGLCTTTVNRKLFMAELSRKGIENYITPTEIGILLERMEQGTLISSEASLEMLSILKNQRLNGKIPVLLPPGTIVAHKTGEDDGITHDVGIVYSKSPFVLCLCANQVDRGEFERTIQTIARMVFDSWN